MSNNLQTIHTRVQLTDEELDNIGKELADKLEERESIEAELKATKAEFKSKIEECSARIKKLATLRRNGWESRLVKCRIVKDFGLKLKYYYSVESGKRIKTEKFNEADFQTEIEEQLSANDAGGDGAPAVLLQLPDDLADVTAVLDYYEEIIENGDVDGFKDDPEGEFERVSTAHYEFNRWRQGLEVSLSDDEYDRIQCVGGQLEQIEEEWRAAIDPELQEEGPETVVA